MGAFSTRGRSRARTVDGQAGLDRFTTPKIYKSTGLVLKKSDKSDSDYGVKVTLLCHFIDTQIKYNWRQNL